MNSGQENLDKDFNFEIFSRIKDEVLVLGINHDILDNVADLSVVYANNAFLDQISEDPVGKTISELFDEDTANSYLNAATQILGSGQGEKFEIYSKSIDHYYLVSAFSPDDENLITIMNNISDSKIAVNKSQKIIEEIDEVYFELNNQWQFINSNSKIEIMAKEELRGKNIWEEFSELKDNDFYTHLNEAKSRNTDAAFDIKFPKTGKWYRVHAYPHSDGLEVYLKDIDQEKTALMKFEVIEIKFKTLFEENNDAIIISDIKTGKYINVNGKAEELTGYSKEELLSMGTGDTSHDLKEMAIEELRKMSNEGNVKIETNIHTRKRGLVPIEVSTSIIEAGEKIYSFSILRDISSIKEAEEDKKELLDQIKQDFEDLNLWKEKLHTESEKIQHNEEKLLKLQEELQESESKYRSLSMNLPSVLMRYDKDLRVIYLVPSAEHARDVSANDFVGKTNREFGMPEELCNSWENAIKKVFQTGEAEEIEFEFPALKNKEQKNFHLKFIPEFTADGETVQNVLGISTEITEGKRAEIENQKLIDDINQLKNELETSKEELNKAHEKLESSQEEVSKYKKSLNDRDNKLFESEKESLQLLGEIEAIYNSAPMGLCVLDGELRFKRVNKKFAEINGLTVHDLIEKRIEEISPKIAEHSREISSFIFKNGLPVTDVEFSTEDIEGNLRTYIEQWVPLKDIDGDIIGINLTMIETTPLKNAEMKLIEVQSDLEDKFNKQLSEYKKDYESINKLYSGLNEIIEASDDLIAAWNTKFELVAFNNAYKTIFTQMFNREPEIGMNIKDVLLDSPESYFEAVKFWEESLKGKRFSVEMVFPIDSKNVFYEITYYPIRNKQGNIVGASHIARDITERQRSGEKLERLVEDLKVSNEELQKFSYTISHDLQEPLRDIATFTQLLEDSYKGKFDEYADELMEYIIEAATDMKNLINGLLDYSRILNKENDIQSIYTNSMVDHVIDDLKTSIEESEGKVTHDNLPNIKGDAAQLQMVFKNLISNAIKFKNTDEPPEVHISAYSDQNEYVFSIADNGVGIEEQYLERIFQIFQRSTEYKGMGIGLSIVKLIIEKHGGHIWVESTPGEGSTFYFTLPFKSL